MKNIIVYILGLLFFISCDAFDDIISDFDENEAELEPNYYIQEGWSAVQSQDFSEAVGFFNYIILNSNNPESSSEVTSDLLFEAYHGFAWSNLLFSSTLYGDNNEEERLLSRDTSYDSFFASESILDTIEYSSEVFDYECDILAGKIQYSDFKIRHYQSEFYASDGNTAYLDSIDHYSMGEELDEDDNDNGHIELGLATLISSMTDNCSNYDFPYASIDINNINMILIKHYIREELYQEAVNHINDGLELPTVSLEFNVQFDDIGNINGEVYLIGDFLNKTIDLNDLHPMNANSEESSIDYIADIELTPYLPCNFYDIETGTQLAGDELRDELLDCVDTYFETSSEVVFRYKYVNGDYSQSVYNQETNLSGECSDSEGYRTINISASQGSSTVLNSCFNSCSSSCFNN